MKVLLTRSTRVLGFTIVAVLAGSAAIQGFLLNERAKDRELREVSSPIANGQLPPVEFVLLDDDHQNGGRITSDSLLAGGCKALIFFSSVCAGCVALAPEWSGVQSVSVAEDDLRLPVVWIAVDPADTGSLRFLRQHHLPTPGLAFRSRGDLFSWSVYRWPMVYVVSPSGRATVQPGPLPGDVVDFPTGCVTRP